jgi:hypothetical protein
MGKKEKGHACKCTGFGWKSGRRLQVTTELLSRAQMFKLFLTSVLRMTIMDDIIAYMYSWGSKNSTKKHGCSFIKNK